MTTTRSSVRRPRRRRCVVRRAARPDDIAAAEWAAAEAVIAYHRMSYDAALCAGLDRCRILVRAGVGCDNVDLAAFAARGIPVCNVPDYGIAEVADHTIALLLALARGVVAFHHARGRRSRAGLGLAALSAAGAPSRRAASADRRLWPDRTGGGAPRRCARSRRGILRSAGASGGHARGCAAMTISRPALAEADIVSLHAALTTATRALIDRRRLAAMKPGAILINTARGGLVDLDALTEALRDGRIAAAGLDVLPREPPDPAHPLFRALRRRRGLAARPAGGDAARRVPEPGRDRRHAAQGGRDRSRLSPRRHAAPLRQSAAAGAGHGRLMSSGGTAAISVRV